jgi:23S rRNA (guanosine2251-2'-O)-methyltransferase
MVQKVYLSKELDKKAFSAIAKTKLPIHRIDDKIAQSMSRGGSHQGILAEIDEFEPKSRGDLKELNRVVVLCGITDVGNIGAIIRTAYALGIDALFVTGMRQINWQGAVKSSSGAVFDMPVELHPNVNDLHNELKMSGFLTLGATLEGAQMPEACHHAKSALFLGSESEGLPGRLVKKLDHQVTIQMHHDFDSLNVSSAAAILIDRMVNERL